MISIVYKNKGRDEQEHVSDLVESDYGKVDSGSDDVLENVMDIDQLAKPQFSPNAAHFEDSDMASSEKAPDSPIIESKRESTKKSEDEDYLGFDDDSSEGVQDDKP